jgi:hypothetical protein
MNAMGQLQPILVTERLSDGSFEVVSGNHRYEACKMLGWPTIRCYLRTSILDIDVTGSPTVGLQTSGGVQINPEYLTFLIVILKRMGFTDPIFQQWKSGQRFGLARSVSSLLEWHVRGFEDGILESEVEISRDRLQHLTTRAGSYYSPLLRVLDRNGIPSSVVGRILPDASYVYPELFGEITPVQVPSITF